MSGFYLLFFRFSRWFRYSTKIESTITEFAEHTFAEWLDEVKLFHRPLSLCASRFWLKNQDCLHQGHSLWFLTPMEPLFRIHRGLICCLLHPSLTGSMLVLLLFICSFVALLSLFSTFFSYGFLVSFPSSSLIFSDFFLLTVAKLTCSNCSPTTTPIPIFFIYC